MNAGLAPFFAEIGITVLSIRTLAGWVLAEVLPGKHTPATNP